MDASVTGFPVSFCEVWELLHVGGNVLLGKKKKLQAGVKKKESGKFAAKSF